MKVKISRAGGTLPAYETSGSAGMDIRAYVEEPVVIASGKRALIPTGISIELPEGCEAQIRARSGLAVKYGIGLVNGIGTVDSDYRGEIKIALINFGDSDFTVRSGDRIAQMVVARYEKVEWEETGSLSQTSRGAVGFGHTGRE